MTTICDCKDSDPRQCLLKQFSGEWFDQAGVCGCSCHAPGPMLAIGRRADLEDIDVPSRAWLEGLT